MKLKETEKKKTEKQKKDKEDKKWGVDLITPRTSTSSYFFFSYFL